MLNISPLVVWTVALSQLLTFGLTVWNLLASGSRANARTLDLHGETLRALEGRLSAVELSLREIPTRSDLHALDKQMTELGGALKVMAERLRPVESISERLQEVLLQEGRK
ncbi:DUF2730 family protein [Halodurantibacterium flavum]|uniref:DUF2730 family protein n=1 Tax=Halodurantibacterium flavum TaxID=1382802 RepID=UPI0036F2A498